MDSKNNKLQERFIGAKIDIFENYYNLTLTIDKAQAKEPEHTGTYSYKGKSREFIFEKISIFKESGYIFVSDCSIPEFRTAMGLTN